MKKVILLAHYEYKLCSCSECKNTKHKHYSPKIFRLSLTKTIFIKNKNLI